MPNWTECKYLERKRVREEIVQKNHNISKWMMRRTHKSSWNISFVKGLWNIWWSKVNVIYQLAWQVIFRWRSSTQSIYQFWLFTWVLQEACFLAETHLSLVGWGCTYLKILSWFIPLVCKFLFVFEKCHQIVLWPINYIFLEE